MNGLMRGLLSLAMWAAMAWLAWLGTHGVTGAKNLFCFLTWFFTVVYFLCAFCPPKKRQQLADEFKKNPIPASLACFYDIAMAGFVVWYGWWMTGIAIIVQMMCEQYLRKDVDPEELD